MSKSYIHNLETGKIELHFEKSEYMALSEELKREIKANYLFSKYGNCWVSRSKNNHHWAIQIAKKLGFTEEQKEGQRLSYAEELERKAERAENRAERYLNYADNAENRGKAMQAELNSHHGDIAFFTQPNINSAGGRAFTNRRNKILDRYHKGFEEYRKSDYFKDKAATAEQTASKAQLKDKVYLHNRIEECNKNIREFEKRIVVVEQYIFDGKPYEEKLTELLDRMEYEMDKLAFMQNHLDQIGGVQYNNENIKPGYLVKIRGTWDLVLKANKTTIYIRIIEGGAKGMELKYPYAEIQDMKIPEGWTEQKEELNNPFEVGDIVTMNQIGSNTIVRAYQIIKTSNKTVTIQRIAVENRIPVKDKFISDKQERKAVKKDRAGNIVVNDDSWYLYKYTLIEKAI